MGYKEKLAEVDKAILANAEFLKQIVANTQMFGAEDLEDEGIEDEEGASGGGGPSGSHSHSHSHGKYYDIHFLVIL